MAKKVISLSRARKAQARADKAAQAASNAVKFGRTRAERAADKAKAERAERGLDGHRRDKP